MTPVLAGRMLLVSACTLSMAEYRSLSLSRRCFYVRAAAAAVTGTKLLIVTSTVPI